MSGHLKNEKHVKRAGYQNLPSLWTVVGRDQCKRIERNALGVQKLFVLAMHHLEP